ncbi:MAG: SPOR domain-containing protein [Helicobacteraceae bacterium]|jgi:cell division septation protein DedD|nr:SPOR domain-containing protein [Helicobacteraceae bacterium]
MAEHINSQDELNDILIKQDDGAGGRVKNALLISAAMLLIAVIAFLTFRVVDASKYEETPSGGLQTSAVNADPVTAEQPKTMFETPQPASNPDQVRSAIDAIIEKHRAARNDQNATPSATAAQTTPVTPPAPPKTTTPPATVAQPAQTTPVTPPAPPKTTPAATPQTPPKTVTPPAAQTTAASSGLFYIQLESLASAPRADYLQTLRSALASTGKSVSVKQKVVNAKTVHRIYLGSYKSREDALGALSAIRRDFSPDAFIVQE